MLPSITGAFLASNDQNDVKGFKIPVPASVEGTTDDGQRFKERAKISFISHIGAIINLENQAGMGTRIRLAIALPPGLSDNKKLSLIIKGEVVDSKRDSDAACLTRTAVRFENRYVVEETES